MILTEYYLTWIMDSEATDQVAHDRRFLVDFYRILNKVNWIYVGNNTRVVVRGIDASK